MTTPKAGPLTIIKAPHLVRVPEVSRSDNGDEVQPKLAPAGQPTPLTYQPRPAHLRPVSHEATGRYDIKTGQYITPAETARQSWAIFAAAIEAIACRIEAQIARIAQELIKHNVTHHARAFETARLIHQVPADFDTIALALLEQVAYRTNNPAVWFHKYDGSTWQAVNEYTARRL